MLLKIQDVCKTYHSGLLHHKVTDAVDHVSFSIKEGEIFGLIGGSGSGKSTLTKMILGLLKPTSGTILYEEQKELTDLKRREWKPLRKEIQCVFQHPQITFNPQRNLYYSCAEPVRLFHLAHRKDEKEYIRNMVEQVGVSFDQLKKYPHEISGGQAQRLSLARALALQPKLLLCDEPTSMLDVSVQEQVLQMLLKANQETGVSMLFVSHDLDVVEKMCSRVAVMQEGKIIETGTTAEVFFNPKCDYTRQLLRARIDL